MTQSPCRKCQDLLSDKVRTRHSDLERCGLSESSGYHGSRDDEYLYVCRICEARFIGDSCGTWPDGGQ